MSPRCTIFPRHLLIITWIMTAGAGVCPRDGVLLLSLSIECDDASQHLRPKTVAPLNFDRQWDPEIIIHLYLFLFLIREELFTSTVLLASIGIIYTNVWIRRQVDYVPLNSILMRHTETRESEFVFDAFWGLEYRAGCWKKETAMFIQCALKSEDMGKKLKKNLVLLSLYILIFYSSPVCSFCGFLPSFRECFWTRGSCR